MEHGSISRLGKRFLWHPFTNMREWCAGKHEPLILVEGRSALLRDSKSRDPDLMILGKGLTGGYLQLAFTLVSEKLFSAFDGSVADGKALAYGHSYTGNALGCAAAKASLEVFEKERVLEALQPKIRAFSSALASLKDLPGLKEIRQCGFIAGIELEEPEMAGAVCMKARRHGLLTRPIWNVVVLMPPLYITRAQLGKAVEALRASIIDVSCRNNACARKHAEKATA
jgi:adenosylmethionine-8-amino-7-oxononanoate aminotransferase